MHDPLTLAFRCKILGCELFEVWHKDPCRGGGDDSCGWSYARPSYAVLKSLGGRAHREARTPWFLRRPGRKGPGAVETEALLRQAVSEVARMAKIPLTADECTLFAAEHAPSFADSFCFEAGWHTGAKVDTTAGRKDVALRLFIRIAVELLTERRPWWRHPRWHLHHWRISCWWLRRFLKRFVVFCRDRCSRCRQRYSWRDMRTEGAIRHFWDSSVHASCPTSTTPAASPQLVAGDGVSKSGGRSDNGGDER